MSMQGSDPDQLDALAVRMTQSGDTLVSIAGHVGGALASSTWVGPDAEAFNGDWSSRLAPIVNAAASALHEGGVKLHFEADQQRKASAAGGGGVGGTGIGGRVYAPIEFGPGFRSRLDIGAAAAGVVAGGMVSGGVAAGQDLHSVLRIGGILNGITNKIFSVARFLNPFGDAKDVASTVGVIDKIPGFLGGPVRGALGFLSGAPGLGFLADAARSPVGKALPIVGAVISGASLVDDVYNITQGGWTSQNEGNFLSDAGGLAMSVPIPPVMVAGAAMMIGSKIDPTWPQDAWRGANVIWNASGAGEVVHETQSVVSTATRVAGNVVNASTSAVGNVWHAATSWIP